MENLPIDKLPLPTLSKSTQTGDRPKRPKPEVLTYLDEYFSPSFIKSYFKV